VKILLVHADKKPWATQRRAEALKREWKDDEVDTVDRWNLPDGDPYDVIHFLFSGGITKCKEYILKNKEKVFTTVASNRSLDGKWDNLDDLYDIYRVTRACVAQNHILAVCIRQIGGVAKFIPNGVDTDLFKRDFVVGYVGAKDSSDHKGYKMIEEVCEELGLILRTANYYQHEEMPEFYREIDCLVLMSESEGCNNPTLEALAMNKPVISTDTGIVRELLGVTIVPRYLKTEGEPLKENNLKEALKMALIKKVPRIQILQEYTWPIIAAKYKELYVRHLS